MTLENICTSLETSRKLAEAGFPQEGGLNYWCFYFLDGFVGRELQTCRSYAARNSYRAFTFSELWEILPKSIEEKTSNINKYNWILELHPGFIGYYPSGTGKILNRIEIKTTPQEAAAELALWCRKEGYL
jgi:hypothetical protein